MSFKTTFCRFYHYATAGTIVYGGQYPVAINPDRDHELVDTVISQRNQVEYVNMTFTFTHEKIFGNVSNIKWVVYKVWFDILLTTYIASRKCLYSNERLAEVSYITK